MGYDKSEVSPQPHVRNETKDDCSDQLELYNKENIINEKMNLPKENIKPKASRTKKTSGGAKKEPAKKDVKKNAKSIPDVDAEILVEESPGVDKTPANKFKELNAKPPVSNRSVLLLSFHSL